MKEKSIPVMVDDLKDIGEFHMTRVTYFYIEALEAPPDIPIDHRSLGIPVLPLEFSGALHQPTDGHDYFETPEQIETLFQAVERYASLYIDSDNIWIPNKLFSKTPARGEVYRVPFNVFVKLYSLCRDDASLDAGIARFGDKEKLIVFSAVETSAFAQWTAGIIEDAIAAYPMNEQLKLAWR